MVRVSVSFQNGFGNFDHKHHGVFGLIAEGFSDDVDSMLMGYALQGKSVHRHQLKPSLGTREGKFKSNRVSTGYLHVLKSLDFSFLEEKKVLNMYSCLPNAAM